MPQIRSKHEKPDASEFGQLRAFLAKLGISQAAIKEAIGDDHNQSRAQIVAKLTVFCQRLPKKLA
jgi:hypothetical protein